MKKNTLIAFIDGSAHMPILCEYAAKLAHRSDASIKLYHVLENHSGTDKSDLSGAINLGARTKLMDELVSEGAKKSKVALSQGRDLIESAKKRLADLGCLNVELRLRTGDIAQTLKNKESGGDLILIGKRGENTSKEKHKIGDNFERIVRTSSKPIFVSNSTFTDINHVLVAFDGSLPSIRVLEYLLGGPIFGKLKISVLGVSKVKEDPLGPEQKSLVMNLNKNQNLISFINVSGDPKQQIMKHINDQKADMLAIGAYGHSKLRNLLIGSTTSALIHSSPVPVLLSK